MKARSLLLWLLGALAVVGLAFAFVPASRPTSFLTSLMRALHGVPAPRPPGPPEAVAAKVSFAADVAPDPQVRDFLEAFAEAIRIHNGAGFKPRLSARYAIEGLPPEADASDFFLQAVAKSKGAKEIVVRSIESRGDLRVVTAEFRTAEGSSKNRTFQFDADGRLVSADFFSLQRQAHGM
jgi:hypothetical protein